MNNEADRDRANLERWACVALPVFGVVGLARASDLVGGGATLITTSNGVQQWVRTTAEVRYRDAEGRSLSVTAHRRDDDAFPMLQTWAVHNPYNAARVARTRPDRGRPRSIRERDDDEWELPDLEWEAVSLDVDGVATPFEVCLLDGGFWAGIGRTADADLTIDSRGIPFRGLRLHRLPEPAPEIRVDSAPVPPPLSSPAVRFPPELWNAAPPASTPGSSLIDLSCQRWSRIVGTIGSAEVDLAVEPRAFVGTVDGKDLHVGWAFTEDLDGDPYLHASLEGRLGQSSVALRGASRGSGLFEHATVDGHIAADRLDVSVQRAAGGWNSDTVAVRGRLADTEFRLYAAIDLAEQRGVLRGTFGSDPVHLDVTPDESREALAVSGCFPGPTPLAVLAIGSLLYFL